MATAMTVFGGVACSAGSEGAQTSPTQSADGGAVEASVDAATPLSMLESYLSGTFDSADQATRDPSYFEIHLTICPVSVPSLGDRVLYVEQARADSLKAPYRQRLYVLESRSDVSVSRVFEFKAPSKVIGLCADPSRLTLAPADVEEKSGCRVELSWDGSQFSGGTVGKDCQSSLNGASYATSEVKLDASGLRSWDRGFDANGKQVWGATKGAYEFTRRTPIQ